MEQINQNKLYPVFFRLDKLKMLIVGAGEVGMEKLHFILKSSPNARITLVAPLARQDVKELMNLHPEAVTWIRREVQANDIASHDLVVAATNIQEVNKKVYGWAKRYKKIVNVADTPSLCDFYMGSIVTKGDLKIAVSTNGKSPTFAKRFRQFLEKNLPDNTESLIQNLKKFRDQLGGSFERKVEALNRITEELVSQENQGGA